MTDSSKSGADYRLGYVDGAKTILKTIGDDLPEPSGVSLSGGSPMCWCHGAIQAGMNRYLHRR